MNAGNERLADEMLYTRIAVNGVRGRPRTGITIIIIIVMRVRRNGEK
jgi:hypothetical protein